MSRHHVVGFGGAAESGKSTSADMLVSIAQPYQHEHIEFSDPILMSASEWLRNVDENTVNDNEARVRLLAHILSESLVMQLLDLSKVTTQLNEGYLKNVLDGALNVPVTPENKSSHRPLLEWLGHTAIELVSPRVWGDIVQQKVANAIGRGADLVTVGGVRTKSDYEVVHNLGGTVMSLHRSRDNEPLLTERQLTDWVADFKINNNGSLEDLRERLAVIWAQISVDQDADNWLKAA